MPIRFEGMPLQRAPAHLVPWLDCVDGAIFMGHVYHFERGEGDTVPAYEIWTLQRAGVDVGRIEVRAPK